MVLPFIELHGTKCCQLQLYGSVETLSAINQVFGGKFGSPFYISIYSRM